MSYSAVGAFGAVTSPTTSSLASRMRTDLRPVSRTSSTTGGGFMMDPGQITPERCVAAGGCWDEVAQQCLKECPPPPEPDPTIPSPELPLLPYTPPPVGPSPEQLCAEAGGCWDPVLADCFVCMDEEADIVLTPPAPPEPAPEPEDDNTAMYVGLGLLLAAGLAGSYFLISRKKKKEKP